MKSRRFAVYAAALSLPGLLTPFAAANNAGHAHHAQSLPATQPSTQPTADTLAHYPCPPAPNLTPAEELKTFRLPPGYRIELVASEPAVQGPVAINFDADGRMWVCEMRGYMPDVYAHNEDAPIGRISVLEDASGRGKYDKATVFLDKLYLPRVISPVGDGVLVASPPYLYFCRDTGKDLHCDQKTELSSKCGVGRDPECGDNGLLWARDNWIYSANSGVRFRYQGGDRFESGPTGRRGQWGISQDDVGRLYFNYNSDQLRGDMIPTEYLSRNPNSKPGGRWKRTRRPGRPGPIPASTAAMSRAICATGGWPPSPPPAGPPSSAEPPSATTPTATPSFPNPPATWSCARR